MKKDNPLLKALSEIPDDYDESSVNLDFELMVLREVISKAATGDASANVVNKAINLQTSIEKLTQRDRLNTIANFNKLVTRYVELLAEEIGANLDGLVEFLTANNHKPARDSIAENLAITRRLMNVAREGKLADVVSYANNILRLIKIDREQAIEDRRLLTTSQTCALLDKTWGKVPKWLEQNKQINEETAGEAIKAACEILAKEITQHES